MSTDRIRSSAARRVCKLAALFLAAAVAAAAEPSPGPPAWFLEHVEFMTREGGRWITDNSAYRSENEPFDQYGMVWEKGIDGQSLKGRLFGLAEGREVATFWEFRTVWHPRENRVHAFQWGGHGVYADGVMIGTGERSHRSEQEFIRSDGSSFSSGHESSEQEDGSYLTRSFDIGPDGSWQPRRSYLWKLSAPS